MLPHPHRAVDVLDPLLAQILERQIKAIAHLLVNASRNANPARLREAFQPRRHVDPVAVDIIAVDHHVAQIDPDAELNALVFRKIGVAFGYGSLCLCGSTNRIDDACELGQHPVAHEFDDTPMVLGDLGIDEVRAQCLEGRYRAFLVCADQAGVA